MKKKFKVFQVDHLNYGNGNTAENKKLLRVTYAVSAKQAINNVRFSEGIKQSDLFCAYAGDGYRRSELVAELV